MSVCFECHENSEKDSFLRIVNNVEFSEECLIYACDDSRDHEETVFSFISNSSSSCSKSRDQLPS
jgi:hypothetical protein